MSAAPQTYAITITMYLRRQPSLHLELDLAEGKLLGERPPTQSEPQLRGLSGLLGEAIENALGLAEDESVTVVSAHSYDRDRRDCWAVTADMVLRGNHFLGQGRRGWQACFDAARTLQPLDAPRPIVLTSIDDPRPTGSGPWKPVAKSSNIPTWAIPRSVPGASTPSTTGLAGRPHP